MSRVNEVENRIKQLEGGKFQKLCNSYLFQKYGLENISPLGSQEGTDKTTKGVPDAFIEHDDGMYTLIMYGTHLDAKKKIKDDILDCLDETKTGISVEKIKLIICCHTSTNITISNIEDIKSKVLGVPIKLIGLGTLAQDISGSKFQGIAKEYLNIGFGTEQIFNIDDFVKAYDRNAMASPLDIEFKFREEMVGQIKEDVIANRAVLISGASGIGKTRISLEICRHFEVDNYQVLCVKNNGQPLYDDLRLSISTPGKYLLFLDDMNQISDIASVVEWIVLNDKEDIEIKLLATVRDYAKVKIEGLLRRISSYKEVKVSNFKNEDIKTIMDECLEIKNTLFQERIAKIANGNIRLAILAGKLAIQDVEKIGNSAEIFKQYYGKIISEGKISSEDIKSLFVVSLLNTVKINDDAFAKILLDEFGITVQDFEDRIHKLHQMELVDLYLEEVVKISDQSFGNYVLEYVLVERKYINIDRLLELGFSTRKARIIYAINTILELFYSKEVKQYFSKQINDRWSKAKPEEQDAYLEAFYPINSEKTLDILDRKISKMDSTIFEITDEFFKKKENNQNIKSLEMKILGGFKNTKYFEDAIELSTILLKKRPDLFMDIYFTFTQKFTIDKTSSELNYKGENLLIDTLWRLRKEPNLNFDFLLLKVIDKLLTTHISITEQGDDNRSFLMINFFIKLNEGCKKLREKLWKILSKLYTEENLKNSVQAMLVTSYWSGEKKHIIPICEFDLSWIKTLFVDGWREPDFDQCLVLSKITEFAERMDINIDSEFNKYEKNEDYQYYEIIAPKDYKDNFEISTEQRKQKIRATTATFLLKDYERLFKIAKHVEKDTVFFNYQIGTYLTIVLKSIPREISKEVFKSYFLCEAPFSHSCAGAISILLEKFGFEKTYKIVNETNFQYKNLWIRTIFEMLTEDTIKDNQLKILLEFIYSQKNETNPSVPRLSTILKYEKFDEMFLTKTCSIIHEISEVYSHIAQDFLIEYYQSGNKLVKVFENNLNDLEKLYMDARDTHFDYDGKILFEILKADPAFWHKYTQYIADEDSHMKHEEIEVFREIWKLEDYQRFIDIAFSNIIQKSNSYIGSENYELIFSDDNNSKEVNSRIKKWIKNFIRDNRSNYDLVYQLFFDFISNQNETDRIYYIEEFLKGNKTIEDFQKLPIIPTSYMVSGSEVPHIDRKIIFLETLLESPFLKGLDFVSHRRYLSDCKAVYNKEKKSVQVREYQDDYFN